MRYWFELLVICGLMAVWAWSEVRAGDEQFAVVMNGTSILRNPVEWESGGTGFTAQAPSGKKYTVTNNHVCRLANKRGYLLSDKRGYVEPVKILKSDPNVDLCLLTPRTDVEAGTHIAKEFDHTTEVRVYGHPRLWPLTMSAGYCPVTQLAPWQQKKRTVWINSYICSCRVAPGSSGSAAVNPAGEAVGVVYAMDDGGNISLIIPLESLKTFLEGW